MNLFECGRCGQQISMVDSITSWWCGDCGQDMIRKAGAARQARYRKVGRAISGVLLIALALGTMVATFYAVMGVIRWLHIPGYVVLPASLALLGYQACKMFQPSQRRND